MTEAAHRDLFGGDLDWTAQYDYDVFNHRVASRYDDDGDGIADRVERYVWDGDQIVLEFVDTDGANNSLNSGTESAPLTLATRYLWGQAVDQLLAQETVSNGSPADVSYIVRDNQGSTRSLVNHLGDVTATYSYDSYGNVSVITGSLTATRFLYTCQEYDTRLGLHYYNARWYSPTLGRFISEDPMGFAAGDANLYRYVGNSPTNYTDPSGLCADGGKSSGKRFPVERPEPLKFYPEAKTPPTPSGRADDRDKAGMGNYYGLPKAFWNWYHRNDKAPGDPDLPSREEALKRYKDWKENGEPDADGHRTKKPSIEEPDPESEDFCRFVRVVVGVTIIVSTIVEDVGTGGVGIADDPVTIGAGAAMIIGPPSARRPDTPPKTTDDPAFNNGILGSAG